MLVLTRKCREMVVIGTGDGTMILVQVTVLSIDGGRVRLGFDVPDNIPVHRLEVWQQLQQAASFQAAMEPHNDTARVEPMES